MARGSSKEEDAGQAQPVARARTDRLWLARLKSGGLITPGLEPATLAAGFWQAVAEFNAGNYWRAHELLEQIWLDTLYPTRLFYYAVIKLAVGLLHLERHNAVGARLQLVSAAEFLEPFTPAFLGVATDAPRGVALDRLRRLGLAVSSTSREVKDETEQLSSAATWVEGSPFWEGMARLPAPRIECAAATESRDGA